MKYILNEFLMVGGISGLAITFISSNSAGFLIFIVSAAFFVIGLNMTIKKAIENRVEELKKEMERFTFN